MKNTYTHPVKEANCFLVTKGFKLGQLNVLIGANGSGKSDFLDAVGSRMVYRFKYLGERGVIRLPPVTQNNVTLQFDGSNIAPYLRMLNEKHPGEYARIVDTIRLALPFFGDFLRCSGDSERKKLEWVQVGMPETSLEAKDLSDGSLRFICLVTLLLQPVALLPEVVLIDEPEIGLHPCAISILADILKQVAETNQVIVATQSVELLNAVDPKDVVVVERSGCNTVLARIDTDGLSDWLKTYSLGELWLRNIIGGRP